ncbi:heme-binding domain-containing protein [Thermomicrobium sp. 4228-Ro]|uniref:heme-binding domain-containing protein n=1 Tax=Thermomicrobium sp. 4228-Ro TaxID=2993937 RepID=UPI00224899A1|nr:heme-binding domain-containing protein [Thermomicrobium sp. 4228-Ro]MCX2727021.1 heme-binding domain-containing protein [Thermomicrobium sp. 4228-Ro]
MAAPTTVVHTARSRWRRVALVAGGVLVALFIALQGIALALPRTNPPVIAEPNWDSPQTRELFMRACGDCHSNQTNWRWYTYVAPAAFLAYRDVTDGRQKCNVSEWGVGGEAKCDESVEQIQKGTMPPWFYLPVHPEANLSAQEKQQLIQGLIATFGEGGEGGGGGEGGEQRNRQAAPEQENGEEEEGSTSLPVAIRPS